MPNGFETELKKWQDIGNQSVADITSLKAQIELPARISPWYEVAKTYMLTTAGRMALALGGQKAAAEQEQKLQERYIKGPTPLELEAKCMTALNTYRMANWFGLAYSVNQLALAKSNIRNWEDYINQHPPEPGTDPAELAKAKAYIDSLTQKPVEEEKQLTEEEMLARGFLTTPLETRVRFKGIHEITVNEMLAWLKRVIPPPELPVGLTEPELRTYLKEKRGLSDEELAEIDATTDPWMSKMAEFEEGRAQMTYYKEGTEAPEMPDETIGKRIKLALLQPALPMLYVAGKTTYLGQHFAPLATIGVVKMMENKALNPFFYFDEAAVDKNEAWQQLQNNYKVNREAGMNWWNAWGKAWEDWEVNRWAKMGIETIVDPVTYLGTGLFVKLGTATKAIPVVGRMTGVLSAGEIGFIKVANIPFDKIKIAMMKIPATASQRATRFGAEGTGSIMAGIGREIGEDITTVSTARYNEAALSVIGKRLAHPELVDDYAYRAGQAFINKQPLTHKNIIEWGRKIGMTIDPSDITDGMVTNLNNLVDSISIRGARIHTLPVEPTIQQILNEVLLAPTTTENMAVIKGLIENVYNEAIESGIKMAKMPVAESLTAAGKNLEKISLLESAEGIYFRNMHKGFAAAISQSVDPIVQRIWREGIDRKLVMPFARAYLVTGAYAPMNYVEEVFRTMFGGGGFIYGKNASLRFQTIGVGLVYDQQITKGAYLATEKYGSIMKRLAGQRIGEAPGVGEISEAALLQQVETEFGKPIVERLLMLGWLPGRKGRIIHEALYFPIRASQWAGGIQRSGYMTKKYLDNLWRVNPVDMENIAKAIGTANELKSAVPGLGKKAYKALYQDITDAATVGPTAVRNVVKKYNIRNIKHSEAIDAINKFTNIDQETRIFLWDKARTGEMWENVGKAIEAAKAKEAEYLTLSPEGKRIWLKSYTDEMLREPLTVDRNTVLAWSHALRDISMDTPATISDLFQGVEEYISRLPTREAREKAWQVAYERINPFLDEADRQARRIMTHIKANAGSTLSPTEMEGLTKYMDESMARIEATVATRLKADARATELIAGKKVRPGTPMWREELSKIWNAHWATDAKLYALQRRAAKSLDVLIGTPDIPKPIINVVGRGLTPADVGQLLYAPGDKLAFGVMNSDAMMGKGYFSEIVKMEADDMALRAGTTREAMGWTDEAIEGVYNQLVYGLRSNPEFHGILTAKYAELDNMARDLEGIRINASFDEDTKKALASWVEKRARNLEQLDIYAKPPTPVAGAKAKDGTAEWWTKKQSAMDTALTDYYKDFTDYTHLNALDDTMSQIFPYWAYEAQRWFWLPRNFATHPGVMNTWGRYMDNSDYGYVHVPGTNLSINITRGTVYKGGLSTLLRRDYPEYYDRMFPEFYSGLDYIQRWGFFPNVFWNLLTVATGGRQPQLGQLLPSIVKTPIDLYVAAHPGSSVAKGLQDIIFPDYFREYQMMTVVSDIATDDQINRDITGVSIWNKIQTHQDLTPEEQELWTRARQKVAAYAPLIEHGSIFRMRQEDRVKAYELWGQFIEEKTGISVEMQRELSRRGYGVGDVCSGLSQLDIMQIEEAQEYKRWISPRLTSSLRPSNEIEDNLIQTEFWDLVRINGDKNRDVILDLETRTFKDKTMSTRDYAATLKDTIAENNKYIHTLHGDKYNASIGKWEVDEQHKTKYSWIPLTLEERAAYYIQKGINLSMNPFDEMLAMWYGTGIKTKIDRETGLPYDDWATYFATQDAITKLMPEHLKAQWESYLRRNETPGRTMYREAMRNYVVPYYNVANAIKSTFSQEEQDLIDEYFLVKNIDRVRASEIEEVVMANGLKLISQYRSKIASARKKYRMVSPVTDAHLKFWGITSLTSPFLTPQAEAIYNELVVQATGIGQGVGK